MSSIEEHRRNLKKLGWSDELIDAFVEVEAALSGDEVGAQIEFEQPEDPGDPVETETIPIRDSGTTTGAVIIGGKGRAGTTVCGGYQRRRPGLRFR